MILGMRSFVILAIPISSFFAGVTLSAVNLEELAKSYDFSFDFDSPTPTNINTTVPTFPTDPAFDLVQVVYNEIKLAPIPQEPASKLTNTKTVTFDFVVTEYVTIPEAEPTVELYAPVNPDVFLFESNPSSPSAVEYKTLMKDASFAVKPPASYMDLFESLVDQAVADYHTLVTFWHHWNVTSLQESIQTTFSQAIKDTYAAIIYMCDSAWALWEWYLSTRRYRMSFYSTIFQNHYFLAALAGYLGAKLRISQRLNNLRKWWSANNPNRSHPRVLVRCLMVSVNSLLRRLHAKLILLKQSLFLFFCGAVQE
jgi:hypothetical protein